MSLSVEELQQFVQDLAADSDRWEHCINHDQDQRTYELIWDTPEVNAWVLCWSEDQDTGFHDHDTSAAAIVVLDGEVREDRLRLDGPPQSQIQSAGKTFTVPPNAIHRVLHSGDRPAVTIHAYSPPLVRTGAYSIGDDGQLLRVSQSFEEELKAELSLT